MNKILEPTDLESNKKKKNEQKKVRLYIILTGIIITNALLAELIGGKIFSLEKLLGFKQGANLFLFGQGPLDFNLTAGVILWPVVFITTDIINEYFGKEGVRRASFITAGLIAYAFVALWGTTNLPPAPFWLDVNSLDSLGRPFNIDEAYTKVLTQGMRIIVGSLLAFLVSQFVDVITFQWLRKATGSKMIWLRATGSTLISQFIDSFIVLFVAFYGLWDVRLIIAVGIVGYIYKFLVAIVLTPLLYVGHYFIDLYLGKEFARDLSEEAAKSNLF